MKQIESMVARGKKPAVVVAAIARELAGFIWAIGQECSYPCQLSEVVGARLDTSPISNTGI